MPADLNELEAQLKTTLGCWNHYLLRLWRECRSFESANTDEKTRIAEEILSGPYQGNLIWGLGGLVMLVSQVQERLDDPDPYIRQEAAVALADFGKQAWRAVPTLLDRLRSSETTPHDRALAAWALPRIGVQAEEAIPILLAVLDETAKQPEADELRRYAAEAVEQLTDSFRVLVPLARRCLADRFWKCRMVGLTLVERLVQRERRLFPILRLQVEPLLNDDLEENRRIARRILNDFEKVL